MEHKLRLLTAWKAIARELQETYGYHHETLIAELRIEGDAIPLTAFGHGQTPLEATARYLQHAGKTSKEIAKLLGRARSAIERALRHSHLRAKAINYADSAYLIPATVFAQKKPASETLCTYLREHYSLTNKQIADALGLDQRTIWTVFERARTRKPSEKSIRSE